MQKGRNGDSSVANRKLSIEWPTATLAAAVYGAFGLLTWHYAALPWWLVLPLGAYLVCLQGSLQHEAVHCHPTPWPWLNELMVLPNLWLWMPYRLYRESHLRHHSDEVLTDPLDDPESYYLTPEAWTRRGPSGRALAWTLNTLLGRLLLGPLVCVWRVLREAPGNLARGGADQAVAWVLHLVSVALVLTWVLAVCDIPLAAYLALFAYPGLSLTLLRSFLEHQAREPVGERSVLIETGPVMSLLFLNNNLHALHHAEPGLAWYRMPTRYRARRGALLAANGGYRYDGYGEIFRRYLLRAKEPPVHPFLGATAEMPAEAPAPAGR